MSSSSHFKPFQHQGWNSPKLKLCYLSPWLALFDWKILLEEKTVKAEVGESDSQTSLALEWSVLLLPAVRSTLNYRQSLIKQIKATMRITIETGIQMLRILLGT
jgi:hypothetical protein